MGEDYLLSDKLADLQCDRFVDRFGCTVVRCQRQFERTIVEVNQRAISPSLTRSSVGAASNRRLNAPVCLNSVA